MKFKEKYIRQIIQEEISQLGEEHSEKESDDSPIEIDRSEMAEVSGNVESMRHALKDTVSTTETKGMKALDDLDQLLNWFNTKLTGGEASEWVQEPSEEELEHLEQELLNKIRGKNK